MPINRPVEAATSARRWVNAKKRRCTAQDLDAFAGDKEGYELFKRPPEPRLAGDFLRDFCGCAHGLSLSVMHHSQKRLALETKNTSTTSTKKRSVNLTRQRQWHSTSLSCLGTLGYGRIPPVAGNAEKVPPLHVSSV